LCLFRGSYMPGAAPLQFVKRVVTARVPVTAKAARAEEKDPRTWLPESLAGVSSSFESLTLVTRNSTSCVSSLVEFSGWGCNDRSTVFLAALAAFRGPLLSPVDNAEDSSSFCRTMEKCGPMRMTESIPQTAGCTWFRWR
jgi:hypothetical protein